MRVVVYDQLLKEMKRNAVLPGFEEAPILFPPTYRYVVLTTTAVGRVDIFTCLLVCHVILCFCADAPPCCTAGDARTVSTPSSVNRVTTAAWNDCAKATLPRSGRKRASSTQRVWT